MSVNITENAELVVNGLTPAAGAGLTLLANPSLGVTNIIHDDYVADTFTINPSTPITGVGAGGLPFMGDIQTGHIVWIQTDQPITVTFTQNLVANSIVVDTFLYMNLTFTNIQFTNTSTVNTAHINLVMAGERLPNPGATTPGIY